MANLILRTLTNPGDTTKGSRLTAEELDQNLLLLKDKSHVNMDSALIDLAAAKSFYVPIGSNTTFAVTNVPAAGKVGEFTLVLEDAGAFVITWFSGIHWNNNIEPAPSFTGKDFFYFYTYDGGVNWYGSRFMKGIL